MASDLPVTQVNGINLDNYIPSRRSYNSVVYIHKKFFNDSKNKIPERHGKVDNPEGRHKEHKNKSNNSILKQNKKSKIIKDIEQTSVNNDEVLDQTIRFAKNIVPIVIPPSNNDTSPVYYTIKTSRKSRTGNNKPKDSSVSPDTLMYKKQQEKRIIETFRKEKFKSRTESCSHESSRSSIENIIISQSLNSSISEISEKRNRRTRRVDKRSNNTLVEASESLEALATELLHTSGEAKIKIHLMDDTAKDLFCESIRKPVIEAIRESVAEIRLKENADSKTVQRYVQYHTQKLDNILDKLTCIEKRLDGTEDKTKTRKVRGKPSALEEISEDITEEIEDELEGDVTVVYSAAEKHRAKSACASARLIALQKIEEVSPSSGAGEEIIGHNIIAPVRCDRLNKIPTRYCWTDSANQ